MQIENQIAITSTADVSGLDAATAALQRNADAFQQYLQAASELVAPNVAEQIAASASAYEAQAVSLGLTAEAANQVGQAFASLATMAEATNAALAAGGDTLEQFQALEIPPLPQSTVDAIVAYAEAAHAAGVEVGQIAVAAEATQNEIASTEGPSRWAAAWSAAVAIVIRDIEKLALSFGRGFLAAFQSEFHQAGRGVAEFAIGLIKATQAFQSMRSQAEATGTRVRDSVASATFATFADEAEAAGRRVTEMFAGVIRDAIAMATRLDPIIGSQTGVTFDTFAAEAEASGARVGTVFDGVISAAADAGAQIQQILFGLGDLGQLNIGLVVDPTVYDSLGATAEQMAAIDAAWETLVADLEAGGITVGNVVVGTADEFGDLDVALQASADALAQWQAEAQAVSAETQSMIEYSQEFRAALDALMAGQSTDFFAGEAWAETADSMIEAGAIIDELRKSAAGGSAGSIAAAQAESEAVERAAESFRIFAEEAEAAGMRLQTMWDGAYVATQQFANDLEPIIGSQTGESFDTHASEAEAAAARVAAAFQTEAAAASQMASNIDGATKATTNSVQQTAQASNVATESLRVQGDAAVETSQKVSEASNRQTTIVVQSAERQSESIGLISRAAQSLVVTLTSIGAVSLFRALADDIGRVLNSSLVRVAGSIVSATSPMDILHGVLRLTAVQAVAAAVGVGILVGALVILGARALSEASQVEILNAQLTVLTGSAEATAAAMGMLGEIATSIPFDDDEIIATYIALEKFGATAVATAEGLEQVADIAFMTNQGFAEVGEQVGRLYQAIAGGEEITRFVRQMRLSGTVTDEQADKIEILAQKVSAGTMTMAEAWPVVMENMNRFAGASDRLAETFTGRLQLMSNAIENLFEQVGAIILPFASVIVQAITLIALGIGQVIAIAGDIVSAVAEPFLAVGRAIQSIVEPIGGVSASITTLVAVMGLATLAAGRMALASGGATAGLASTTKAIVAQGAAVGATRGILEEALTSLGALAGRAGGGLADELGRALGRTGKLVEAASGAAQAFMDKFTDEARRRIDQAGSFIDGLGDRIARGFAQALGGAAGSAADVARVAGEEVAGEMGEGLIAGLSEGAIAEGAAGTIGGNLTADSVKKSVGAAAGTLASTFSTTLTAGMATAGAAASAAMGAAMSATNAVTSALTGTSNAARTVLVAGAQIAGADAGKQYVLYFSESAQRWYAQAGQGLGSRSVKAAAEAALAAEAAAAATAVETGALATNTVATATNTVAKEGNTGAEVANTTARRVSIPAIVAGTAAMSAHAVWLGVVKVASIAASAATTAFALSINVLKIAIGPVGWIIAALTLAVVALAAAWENNFLGIRSIVEGTVNFITGAFGGLLDVMRFVGQAIDDFFATDQSRAAEATRQAVEAEADRIESTAKEMAQYLPRALEESIPAVQQAAYEQTTKVVTAYREATQQIDQLWQQLNDGLSNPFFEGAGRVAQAAIRLYGQDLRRAIAEEGTFLGLEAAEFRVRAIGELEGLLDIDAGQLPPLTKVFKELDLDTGAFTAADQAIRDLDARVVQLTKDAADNKSAYADLGSTFGQVAADAGPLYDIFTNMLVDAVNADDAAEALDRLAVSWGEQLGLAPEVVAAQLAMGGSLDDQVKRVLALGSDSAEVVTQMEAILQRGIDIEAALEAATGQRVELTAQRAAEYQTLLEQYFLEPTEEVAGAIERVLTEAGAQFEPGEMEAAFALLRQSIFDGYAAAREAVDQGVQQLHDNLVDPDLDPVERAGFLLGELNGKALYEGLHSTVPDILYQAKQLQTALEDELILGYRRTHEVIAGTSREAVLEMAREDPEVMAAAAAYGRDLAKAQVDAYNEGLLSAAESVNDAWANVTAIMENEEGPRREAARLLGVRRSQAFQDGLTSRDDETRLKMEQQGEAINARLSQILDQIDPELAQWRANLAAGIEQAAPPLDASLGRLQRIFGDNFRALKPTAYASGSEAALAVADGIRSQRDAIESAINNLNEDAKNALSRTQEIGRIAGTLVGRGLSRGLRSADELVRADARALRELLLERLQGMAADGRGLGQRAMQALTRAIRDARGPMRAALADIRREFRVNAQEEEREQRQRARERRLADSDDPSDRRKAARLREQRQEARQTAEAARQVKETVQGAIDTVSNFLGKVFETPKENPAAAWVKALGDPTLKEQARDAARGLLRAAQAVLNAEGVAGRWEGYGTNVGDAWVDGVIAALNDAQNKTDISNAAADALKGLKGKSPPEEGPLREIDTWGMNVAQAWVDAFSSTIGDATGQIASNVARIGDSFTNDIPRGMGSTLSERVPMIPPGEMRAIPSGLGGGERPVVLLGRMVDAMEVNNRLLAQLVAQEPMAAEPVTARGELAKQEYLMPGGRIA